MPHWSFFMPSLRRPPPCASKPPGLKSSGTGFQPSEKGSLHQQVLGSEDGVHVRNGVTGCVFQRWLQGCPLLEPCHFPTERWGQRSLPLCLGKHLHVRGETFCDLHAYITHVPRALSCLPRDPTATLHGMSNHVEKTSRGAPHAAQRRTTVIVRCE